MKRGILSSQLALPYIRQGGKIASMVENGRINTGISISDDGFRRNGNGLIVPENGRNSVDQIIPFPWRIDQESGKVAYQHERFTFFPESKTIVRKDNDEQIGLEEVENKVALYLVDNLNKYLGFNEIHKIIWNDIDSSEVSEVIRSLRKKTELDPKRPEIFLYRHGYGHILRDKQARESKIAKLPKLFNFKHDYDGGFLVYDDGKEVPLEFLQNKILKLLADNFGKPVAHERLFRLFEARERVGFLRDSLRVRISLLSKHLDEKEVDRRNDRQASRIQNVRGYGYMLVDPSRITG